MKYNGCVNILSSRYKCLPYCLKSLWDKWNYRYNYPVYVHYFDDIYDSERYRELMWKNISENIHFRKVPYETPSFIKEEELFYNRKKIQYVKTSFDRNRKGYLHMCHFYNNLYMYPNTELHKYDYFMSIDDESKFTKEVPYDFFEVISKQKDMAGALKLTDSVDKPPKQNNFDTRIEMHSFVLEYMKKHHLQPKCEFVEKIFDAKSGEKYFHEKLIYSDSYVFKNKLFETEEWQRWNKEVNKSGGIYKFRWGDHELNSLFFLIHYGKPVYDFKTVDEGYHDQGGFRNIQNYAPGVKDLTK